LCVEGKSFRRDRGTIKKVQRPTKKREKAIFPLLSATLGEGGAVHRGSAKEIDPRVKSADKR